MDEEGDDDDAISDVCDDDDDDEDDEEEDDEEAVCRARWPMHVTAWRRMSVWTAADCADCMCARMAAENDDAVCGLLWLVLVLVLLVEWLLLVLLIVVVVVVVVVTAAVLLLDGDPLASAVRNRTSWSSMAWQQVKNTKMTKNTQRTVKHTCMRDNIFKEYIV